MVKKNTTGLSGADLKLFRSSIFPRIARKLMELEQIDNQRKTVREIAKHKIIKLLNPYEKTIMLLFIKEIVNKGKLEYSKDPAKIAPMLWTLVKKFYDKLGLPLSKYEEHFKQINENHKIERVTDAQKAAISERERLVHRGAVEGKVNILFPKQKR